MQATSLTSDSHVDTIEVEHCGEVLFGHVRRQELGIRLTTATLTAVIGLLQALAHMLHSVQSALLLSPTAKSQDCHVALFIRPSVCSQDKSKSCFPDVIKFSG